MNNVIGLSTDAEHSTTVGQLIYGRSGDKTAFIGRLGSGPTRNLYIIAWPCIVQANDPRRTWTDSSISITVERYVDIDIVIK